MQGQRSWPMLAVGDSARKDRLRMLMFSSFEVVYKVSALRSEFQENWRKILLPEAYLCISLLLESFLCLSLSAIPFPLSELLEGSYHNHRLVLRCQSVQNVAVRLWPGLIDLFPFRILSHHA